MANMNIRMDDTVKKQAEELFSDLGMNMTTAINIFLKQAVRENRIPFEICRNVPNATVIPQHPYDITLMSSEELKMELQKGIESIEKGYCEPAEKVFSDLRKELGI